MRALFAAALVLALLLPAPVQGAGERGRGRSSGSPWRERCSWMATLRERYGRCPRLTCPKGK